jgi:hypothetical protein
VQHFQSFVPIARFGVVSNSIENPHIYIAIMRKSVHQPSKKSRFKTEKCTDAAAATLCSAAKALIYFIEIV